MDDIISENWCTPGLPTGNYYAYLGYKYAYFNATQRVTENPGDIRWVRVNQVLKGVGWNKSIEKGVKWVCTVWKKCYRCIIKRLKQKLVFRERCGSPGKQHCWTVPRWKKVDWSAVVLVNFMSTRKPGNPSLLKRWKAFFYFLIWRSKPPNQKIKKVFQCQRSLD